VKSVSEQSEISMIAASYLEELAEFSELQNRLIGNTEIKASNPIPFEQKKPNFSDQDYGAKLYSKHEFDTDRIKN
jgi:hypothetical protein